MTKHLENILDMVVTPSIEAGARSLYESSPPFCGKGEMWRWLTPAIRNRWRRRFRVALNKAMEAIPDAEKTA